MAGIQYQSDEAVMRDALQLARRGLGSVEPNPPVGAILVDSDRRLISSGYHERFGGPHAEVHAIRDADRTEGGTLAVTLEPCSHHGKTPPCADAVINAGIRRVVIGCSDPAAHVSGQGIARLKHAGIDVTVGVLQQDAEALIAPFRKLQIHGRPWVHAKWAMTLDGRIAARTGHSKWISNEQSRALVHQLRGRMDAIVTGSGTVRQDNPELTARPAGPRTATRIVCCSTGRSVTPTSQLVRTIDQAGLILCVDSDQADQSHLAVLKNLGVEILQYKGTGASRIAQLLDQLGQRHMTHVLLEAGPGLLGAFFDGQYVDEISVFIAPKLVGGQTALSPVGGKGLSAIPAAASLDRTTVTNLEDDLLINGYVTKETRAADNDEPAPDSP